MTGETNLPPTLVAALEAAPRERPVALLLRHAARPSIPAGELGDELAITDEGARAARALGRLLGDRLAGLATSPVRRCLETAEQLCAGSGVAVKIRADRLLGDPGVLVEDPGEAWRSIQAMGVEEIVRRLLSGAPVLGFRGAHEATSRMVEATLATLERPGIHVLVTHDLLVATFGCSLLGVSFASALWPDFLDGAAFWRDGDALRFVYRGRAGFMPLLGRSDGVSPRRRSAAPRPDPLP